MKLIRKSLVAAAGLTCDLYVLIILFDAFISGGGVSAPMWERTPLSLLIWWPAPLFGGVFKEGVGAVAVLFPNIIVYTLLLYPFFRWRAERARLH